MRARYSAYAKRLAGYVERTWHPATRPADIDLDGSVRWTGLSVVSTVDGTAADERGTVEFVAEFVGTTGASRLHEVSRFERVDGEWSYRSGR